LFLDEVDDLLDESGRRRGSEFDVDVRVSLRFIHVAHREMDGALGNEAAVATGVSARPLEWRIVVTDPTGSHVETGDVAVVDLYAVSVSIRDATARFRDHIPISTCSKALCNIFPSTLVGGG
ncbi:unnamed protein product, partial [Ixodes pacificus]